MRRQIIAALATSLIANSAAAQTWVEQQQFYNDKANLETELFQQREELERMRQENKRALSEQRREVEQQRYDSQQQDKKFQLKHDYPATSTQVMDSTKLEEAVKRAQRDAENKAFVLREEPQSPIKFREEHFSKLIAALESRGIRVSPQEEEDLRYSGKAMWLRKAKAAQEGSAPDQRELGIAYLQSEAIQRDYKQAVKWLRKASDQGDKEAYDYLDRMAELKP